MARRRGFQSYRLLLAGALVFAIVQPGSAQSGLPQPVDEAEAAVLPDFARAIQEGEPKLTTLDPLLAKLPRPTPLRGIVQSARAVALLSESRLAEAQQSAEEAVRLSPGAAYPRIVASYVLTFTGAYVPAAGYWLEASVIDPNVARQSDEYSLTALVGRLREFGNLPLADRIAARMGEIGVVSSMAPTRSSTALARVRTAFASGGAAAAQPAISAVLDPADMLQLYVDRRYVALWPGIDIWAGGRFSPLHARYVEELRREWWASPGYDAAVNYARYLNRARAYRETAALFLPMLTGERAREYESGMEFLAPAVARALVASGRRAEAMTMLRRIEALVPGSVEGMRLNLSAAILTQSYDAQEWAQLAPAAAAWIAAAERLGPDVNTSALLAVQTYRVCALERLGRKSEAAMTALNVESRATYIPWSAMNIYACRGDLPSARALMIRALNNPDTRAAALVMLQPDVADPNEQPMSREIRLFFDKLRAEADVSAAAAKVGRLLPYAPLATLPEGFDPMLAGPKGKPAPNSI